MAIQPKNTTTSNGEIPQIYFLENVHLRIHTQRTRYLMLIYLNNQEANCCFQRFGYLTSRRIFSEMCRKLFPKYNSWNYGRRGIGYVILISRLVTLLYVIAEDVQGAQA